MKDSATEGLWNPNRLGDERVTGIARKHTQKEHLSPPAVSKENTAYSAA